MSNAEGATLWKWSPSDSLRETVKHGVSPQYQEGYVFWQKVKTNRYWSWAILRKPINLISKQFLPEGDPVCQPLMCVADPLAVSVHKDLVLFWQHPANIHLPVLLFWFLLDPLFVAASTQNPLRHSYPGLNYQQNTLLFIEFCVVST